MTADTGPVPTDTLLAHRAWVTSLAHAMLRDPHGAEDAAQDTWVAALETPPQPGNTRGWLGTVLSRRVFRQRRQSQRRRAREAQVAQPEALPSTADLVAKAESHRRVADAVLELPEPYRSTVLLRYFEGLPTRRIAEHHGVPLETARTRLRRAHERIRVALGDGDDGAWRAVFAPLIPAATLRTVPEGLAAGVLAMSPAVKIAASAAALSLSACLYVTVHTSPASPPQAASLHVAGAGGQAEPDETADPRLIDAARTEYERLAGLGYVGVSDPVWSSKSSTDARLDSKITLDLDSVPLGEAAEVIGQTAGLNIVVDPAVAEFSVSLEAEEASVRSVLESLATSAGATVREEGGIIVIAPSDPERDTTRRAR